MELFKGKRKTLFAINGFSANSIQTGDESM